MWPDFVDGPRKGLLSRRDSMKVARYEVPGSHDKQVPCRRERYD